MKRLSNLLNSVKSGNRIPLAIIKAKCDSVSHNGRGKARVKREIFKMCSAASSVLVGERQLFKARVMLSKKAFWRIAGAVGRKIIKSEELCKESPVLL